MTTPYDLLDIGLYLAFTVAVGAAFARKSRDTSDYFRAGGSLPWWVTGASAWMASFSAWTFTGAAGKFYETGTYVLVLYYANLLPLLFVFFFACRRFRRLRVVTAYEAIRLRFGPGSQQFYTWIRLPVSILFAAISLNAVGVFLSAFLGLDEGFTLFLVGAVVTAVSLVGGAYAVAASDFVQMLLVVTVTLVVAGLSLHDPAIGGLAGLIRRAPASHFAWSGIARPQFIAFWWLALTANLAFGYSSLADDRSSKYLMAKSDRHARLSVAIPLLGALLGPLFWMVPPMTAAILHPNLAALFPQLRHPEEAAFLATAGEVLPRGMLGLLACGIFAATLSHTDCALNQGAGLLVRNFYLPVRNPRCPERRLLLLGKAATGLLGAAITAGALLICRVRSSGLFDLANQLGASLLVPLCLPACLGLFIRRTPPWSAWSTVLVGTAASLAAARLKPGALAWLPGFAGPYRPEEVTEMRLFTTVAAATAACVGWFLFSRRFYDRSSPEHRASVEDFFRRLETPLPDRPAAGGESRALTRTIGKLCLLYGAFVSVFALAPNPALGRSCFVFCGGVIGLVGAVLTFRTGRPVPQSVSPVLASIDQGLGGGRRRVSWPISRGIHR